jgi:hypothetical protein
MSKFVLDLHIVLKGEDQYLLESLETRIRTILELYDDELDIEVGGGLELEVGNVQKKPEPV